MSLSPVSVQRLKNAGFGVNPGDFFYDWIKTQLHKNGVDSVSDLLAAASYAGKWFALERGNATDLLTDLHGDVTFIASEIVSQNKIEFPRMWNLFTKNMNDVATRQVL